MSDSVSLHITDGATPEDICKKPPVAHIAPLERESAVEIDLSGIPDFPPELVRTKRLKTAMSPVPENALETEEGEVKPILGPDEVDRIIADQRAREIETAQGIMTLEDARALLENEEQFCCECVCCEEDFDAIYPDFSICQECEVELKK